MSNIIKTGKVRFSFVNVFEPKVNEGGEPKYSITLLIPKSDTATVQAIYKEMDNVLNEATAGTFGGIKPANPKLPIYDGDGLRPGGEPFGEECKGHLVMTANSIQRPGVVDQNLNEIMSRDELYSGCYGRASLRFYAYNKNGNKGVGCGLNNLQKLEDGQPLSGRTLAKDDFADSTPQPVMQQPLQQVQTMTQQVQQINPITGQPMNILGV